MSDLTKLHNKTFSVTGDMAIGAIVGLAVGGGLMLLPIPWETVPLIGRFIPVGIGAVVGAAVYHRQRANLLKQPPAT